MINSILPPALPLKRVIQILFNVIVENNYALLLHLPDADCERDEAEEVRLQFDQALGEVRAALNLPNNAEVQSDLADMVLEVWKELDEFLNTTAIEE